MADDSMIIGESWLSEHFFTTDSKSESFREKVTKRHKLWKATEDEGHESARSRFKAQRSALVDAYGKLGQRKADADARDEPAWRPGADAAGELDALLYDPLATALGANTGFVEQRREGPVRWLHDEGVEAPFLAIIEALPAESIDELLRKGNGKGNGDEQHQLARPYVPEDDENHPVTAVTKLLSRVFQVNEVPYAIVFAGEWLLVTDRDRWPEGRYLAVDLQLVIERNDTKQAGELDRAIAALAVESFESAGLENSGTPWWTEVIEASKKHAVGVSEDLREGVRLSIEDIANEVVRRRAAQGLEPLPNSQAQPLAVQALRYLYRILFLLYAEASPELEVLPVGSPEYGEGYSVDRLRDLALVELESERARNATHIYASLGVLFRLIDTGHGERRQAEGEQLVDGLTFHSLRADLFRPEAISLIDEVGLGDGTMTRVLERLLLSKKQKGQDRGFISYADLGINQLGAVYEGLMSYTGFFAEDDLYEVAKNGDSSKGSWVVPVTRASHLDDNDFVMVENERTGVPEKVVHRRGTFVYRLSGRARQQSASYYTPEVLTKFTVSQALAELLDQNDTVTTADEILGLTVCEPALGSGAFAIEATRQLAGEYLKRKQAETGETIEPEAYPQELQRVKAHIALHQVYGVDLNATAVELAEISLWLDTMLKGLDAPWFGLHLRRGNSLIGARRAVYAPEQLKKKVWLKTEPTEIPATSLADDLRDERLASKTSGKIFHFLLPAEGWAAAADNKEVKDLSPEGAKALRNWRKQVTAQPNKKQIDTLQNLSMRVERLWQFVVRRFEIAEREARRPIELFGQDARTGRAGGVSREEIERKLQDADGAYQRLRLVMNAWCAFWFWPVPIGDRNDVPPTFEQWLEALQQILGGHIEASARAKAAGQTGFHIGTDWHELGESEQFDLDFASALPIDDVVKAHPWLTTVQQVSDAQGFFHWDLDFASVMANNGGFDLQVGNPPWVRPQTDKNALLAERDPWWMLAVRPSQREVASKRDQTLSNPGLPEQVTDGLQEVVSSATFLGSETNYSILAGLTPDLYRCFIVSTERNASDKSIVALIHPETHFVDSHGGVVRRHVYSRLRRHWNFRNDLKLFEIDAKQSFGVHVYGSNRDVEFIHAVSIYHPELIESSLHHDGAGVVPGLLTDRGKRDMTPHRGRIMKIRHAELVSWRDFHGDKLVPVMEAAMVFVPNVSFQEIITQLASNPRLGDRAMHSTSGWNETTDRAAGVFDFAERFPETWEDVILVPRNIDIATVFHESPPVGRDETWRGVDLRKLSAEAVPVSEYIPSGRDGLKSNYPQWEGQSSRDFYRLAWRRRVKATNARTLALTVIPPGAAHINRVITATLASGEFSEILLIAGISSSMVSDMQLRIVPRDDIYLRDLERVRLPEDPAIVDAIVWRIARLICLTEAYEPLWNSVKVPSEWALNPWWKNSRALVIEPTRGWSLEVPLRVDAERRQALLEIDALLAIGLGLSVGDLVMIYKMQFTTLRKRDRNELYFDANGNEVPGDLVSEWLKRGDDLTQDELYVQNAAGNYVQYELPFRTLDREAEMREAYAYFEKKLQES